MNLIGFVQALLTNISLIAGSNDPQTKVTPVGFLKMLLENNAATQINNLDGLRSGQERTIKLRYMQRGLESEVTDIDDCDTPLTAEWQEAEIERPLFSKIGIFISDEQMRQYQEEATQTLAQGTPATPLMRALYETLVVKINGLIQKIDSNLVAAQATAWGVNAAYGTDTAQSIAFGEKATMNDGFVKLQLDAQANEVSDGLLICGNGKVNAYDIYQKQKLGTSADGIGALGLNTYYDPKTTTAWGADHFGAFVKGLVGFVDFNKNVGSYAGQKGESLFFTLPIPVQLSSEVSALTFDCQLKYQDCPVYDASGNKVADRGWKLIVSKSYGLFNAPSDMFATGDPLAGFNGSLHYVATEPETPIVPVAVTELPETAQ